MFINKKNKDDDVIIIDNDEKKHTHYIKYIIIGLITIIALIFIICIIKSLLTKKTTYSIELKGDKEITIYVGTEYLEPGYAAYDDDGNDNTSKLRVINTVETNKLGTYEIAYIIGNTIEKRKVNVIEEEDSKTVIHLKGDLIEYYELGSEYHEAGYVAIDNIDGDITDKVIVSGTIDPNKKGMQKITYSVENSKGIVTSIYRTIIMSKSSIVLTLDKQEYTNSNVTINMGVIDKFFSYVILPNGQKINTKTYQYTVTKNGTYTFTKYDTDGNKKEESITVKNIDKTPPTGTCKAEVGENTKITINARDENGIKYYKFNGNNYYSNNILVSKKLSSVKITVYDNATNSKEIVCTVKNVSSSSTSKSSSSKKSNSSSKSSSSRSSSSKSSSSKSSKASSSSTPKPSSSSTPKPSSSSSSKPSTGTDYDVISNTYSGNKHIADFLAMFEGADKTQYSNGYECNNGEGYIVKDYTTVYTTAYGLTNLSIKDESNPNGVYPCDTMSANNKKYFTRTTFVPNKCIPKSAIREALVCEINYAKNYINNRIKKCNSQKKFTKQEMAALVDYFNSGVNFMKKVIDAYCNSYDKYHSESKAEDAMFKKIFAKEKQGNRHGDCRFIKRRECEAALYYNGNYTCYGQNIYSNDPFNYRFKKYHDSGYSCTK